MNQPQLPLLYFTKHFPNLTVEEWIERASQLGFEGLDIACRPKHTINPDNIGTALPKATEQFRRAGLDSFVITGDWDLIEPNAKAEAILAAMQAAGITLLKPGYYAIHNDKEDYWEKVDYIRKQFDGWTKLCEKYNVKLIYHTHSMPHSMGLNAAAVMHLVKDFDPRWIGVYLDPGHLLLDGEHPDIAFNMVKKHLGAIALKDTRKTPNPVGHGWAYTMCRAGYGDVDWENVFANLKRLNYTGPLSVHAEYERSYAPGTGGEEVYLASVVEEFKFFKRLREHIQVK